jgi:hypothetical protein
MRTQCGVPGEPAKVEVQVSLRAVPFGPVPVQVRSPQLVSDWSQTGPKPPDSFPSPETR